MKFPNPLHSCNAYSDVLKVEDGIILHGKSLVILPIEREKDSQAIHEGHLGITKCQYHAWQCVYWPGINSHINHTFQTCITCQHHHLQELQQPPHPTQAPEHPWQHLCADFFHFDGSEYLIVTDYYSKMPIVEESLHHNAMLQRQYPSWRSYFQNMEFQILYALTMTHHLQMHNLPQILSLITTQVLPGVPEVMDKQKLLWRSSKGLTPVPVLWPGSISSPSSILQHSHQFKPVLISRTSVLMAIMYHNATAYAEHISAYCSWLRLPWWTHFEECCMSWLPRLQEKIPTLC